MAEPVKFTFDQAFDGGAKNRYEEDVANLKNEIEETRTSAQAAGFEAGRAQALQEIEAATLEALTNVANAAQTLMSQQQDLENNLKQEMVQLSYAIASKLAPSLIRQRPLSEIEGLIEECLTLARKEPRIVIRVSPELLDSVSKRIDSLKAASAFPGDIVLIDDAALAFQDCRVEWPDGGLERKFMDIQAQVQDAVQRYVMAQFETHDWTPPPSDTLSSEALSEDDINHPSGDTGPSV